MPSGEEKAWGILSQQDPDDVCRRAQVSYDRSSGRYTLPSFGMDFSLDPLARTIAGTSPDSERLLQRIGYFFRLSALVYLTAAKECALTGRLIKPEDLSGGHLFFRGSHVLPLSNLAEKYHNNLDAFIQKGISLAGGKANFGDAAFRLLPFPRIPAIIIFWLGDDEFPPRANLLFDSSSEIQLPVDILWSIAMMSVIAMM